MDIIYEDIQIVKVDINTALSPHAIDYALRRAQSNKMYAKFMLNNLYVQVNFMRDGSISVASNIRHKGFLQDKYKMEQVGWTIPNVKRFVFQWMNISKRLLW